MGERDCDPDDPEHRDRDRERDPGAIRARDGGDEDQRDARRERDHHLVLVAVERGRDKGRRGNERGDQERPCLACHAEELRDPDAGEADHRDREQLPADDHDRDQDRDPGHHPGDPRQGLGAAAPRRLAVRAPAAPRRRPERSGGGSTGRLRRGWSKSSSESNGRDPSIGALASPEPPPPGLVLAQGRLERRTVELGPEASLKTSSEYAHCQSRKLEIRCSPLVRIRRSGSCISGCVEVVAERVLGVAVEAPRRVDDLRPAAVVEGDEEGDPLGWRRSSPRPSPSARPARRRLRSRRPMNRIRTPSASSSGVSRSMRSANICHQRRRPRLAGVASSRSRTRTRSAPRSPSSAASRRRALTVSAPAR